MAFVEHIAGFFSTSDFGVPATWTHGGTPVATTVIFDSSYFDPLGQFEGAQPMAWAPTADMATVAQGDTLAIGGTTYTVVEVQPDGTGVTAVRLRT